uniref:F-box domain-containing protein n=1 Tax=Trichuris muris TaxID=70415 RepID=A0A5S6QY73_TRIMR
MTTSIDALNEDVLCRIFEQLPFEDWLSCSSACRRWNTVFVKLLWPKVTCLDLKGHFRQPILQECSQVDAALMRKVLRRSGCHVKTVSAKMISADRRSRRCFTARVEMTKPVLTDIALTCSNLTVLYLSGFVFRSFDCFSCLRSLPPCLTGLFLQWCRLDHYGPSVVSVDSLFKDIMRRYDRLEYLSVRGSCYGCWLMTENAFSECVPAGMKGFDLAENFTAKIRHLRWAPMAPMLVELHLERASINNDDLEILVDCCRSLRVLTIAYSSGVRNFAPLSRLASLRRLALNGNRDHFLDTALGAICRQCSHLESLSLESCSSLSEEGLMALATVGSLRELNVSSVPSFTDNCLEAVCRGCTQLTNLNIKYCQRLTRVGLGCLLLLKRLSVLGVSGLKQFDRSLMFALCKGNRLRHLEAENCPNVSSINIQLP